MATNGEIAANAAYDMFCVPDCQYIFFLLFFCENFFRIVPFPDHCLLLPFLILFKALSKSILVRASNL